MKSYLELLEKVYTEGKDRGDRTGTGTRSLFGERLVFDLADGFPILTTKKVSFNYQARQTATGTQGLCARHH